MEEKIIYNFILVQTKSKKYMGWSRAKEKPPCGEPNKLKWFAWGKELPEDINTTDYIYDNGELKAE